MRKKRFIIVGSGWRSLYYVRIAKALSEQFELCAMLCRSQQKADLIAHDHGIHTTVSIDECIRMNPDFVVVAVDKQSIAKVSMEWMNYGFTVLCETPAATNVEELNKLWELHKSGKKLMVAEQYIYYPSNQAALKLIKTGIIGQTDYVSMSMAHEYHGASLIRAFLQEKTSTGFSVQAVAHEFATVETLNRYECFTDGRVKNKKRVLAVFEFEDGKTALYDFDSEQYRSPIRNNYIKVQGLRGELKDNKIYFLDENFCEREADIVSYRRLVNTASDNPNLKTFNEIEKIVLEQKKADDKVLYEAVFGLCGLSEDETAIAQMMERAAVYSYADKDDCENYEMELSCALQDAYMGILLNKAVESGKKVRSESKIWQI